MPNGFRMPYKEESGQYQTDEDIKKKAKHTGVTFKCE